MSERKHVKLLVIDEHDSYFGVLSQYADIHAGEYQFDLRFAGTKSEAMEVLTTWGPSVILLDAHLPDMHGFDLLDECKTSIAPVIVTSVHRSKGIEDAARAKGASGYLAKSDNPDEMDQLIQKLAEVAVTKQAEH